MNAIVLHSLLAVSLFGADATPIRTALDLSWYDSRRPLDETAGGPGQGQRPGFG